MKVAHILAGSFLIVLILFSTTIYLNDYYRFRSNKIATDSVQVSEIVLNSERFQKNFQDMAHSVKNYLFTSNTKYLQRYDSVSRESGILLKELNKFVRDNSDQKILLDDIQELRNYWISEFAAPLITARQKWMTSEKNRHTFNEFYLAKLSNHLEEDVAGTMQRKFIDFIDAETGENNHLQDNLASPSLSVSHYLFYTSISFIVLVSGIAVALAYYISSQLKSVMTKAFSIMDINCSEIKKSVGNEFHTLTGMLNEIEKTFIVKDRLLKQVKEEQHHIVEALSREVKASVRGVNTAITWVHHDTTYTLPPKLSEYLQFIKHRMARTEVVLSGIQTYLNVDLTIPKAETTDVNELLLQVLEHVPVRPGIELHIQAGLPIFITESTLLLTVFRHLIINAFQFHDKTVGKVNVYHEEKANFYEFFVHDDGPGIAHEDHQRIFALFQTLRDPSSNKNCGVGLAIVKKILDEHNLPIRLASAPGKGTTFSFLWPVGTSPA